MSKNIYKYNFDINFPQHNLRFYQKSIIIKLNKINTLHFTYNNKNNDIMNIYEMDDWEVRKLIVNNSAFFNKLSIYENIILEALNILNIQNLKYNDIMVFYHGGNMPIRTYVTKYNKSYKNFVKNIIDTNLNSFCEIDNIINKQYDFIFINKVNFNKKIQLIISNLKMNGSGLIYYHINNYERFEYFITIMSYMFNNVYLFKPNYIMGHQLFVYILIKEKNKNINFNFTKNDDDIEINYLLVNVNSNNVNTLYENINILYKTVTNTYNEVCMLKNNNKKRYTILKNSILKNKNKIMFDKVISAKMNKIYLNLE